MAQRKEQFSVQADPASLAAMLRIAADEGCSLQAVIEEVLQDVVDKHPTAQPRSHLMAHFHASLERNRELGRLLAQVE